MPPKRKIDIRVTTDRLAYLPGAEVTASVRLVADEPLTGVECSVALVHVDRCPVGDAGTTDDRAVAGEYVLDEDDPTVGRVVERTVVLPVPRRIVPPAGPQDCVDERFPPSGDDADPESYDTWIEPEERWGPPTSVGAGGSSEWLVRCEVSGAGTPSEPAEVPVVVLAPEVAAPAGPAVRRSGGAPVCAVAFHGLPRASVAPGTALRGTVRLTAKDDLTVRGVRVALVRVTTVTAGRGGDLGRSVREVTASGPLELKARRPKDVAFTVEVPHDAGPSIVAEAYRVEWVLRAVLDRRLRRDEVWEQPVAVHTA